MSQYSVLYRKYRPNNLEEFVGRENIIRALKNAIHHHRLAHAYLFCGPRGTGKTSLARVFAKEINGTEGYEDIIEIDAASNNGVEEIRNLVDRIKFAPIKGKYKIYIVDEVHMMTTGAFNAFLKTIEEPPSYVIFILATTEPHKVIQTILSRCQRYDFKAFDDKEIIDRLNHVAKIEKIKIDEESVIEIAKLSNGGMRDALSILDQLSNYCDNEIKINDLEEFYGTVSLDKKQQLLNIVLKKDKVEIKSFLENEIFVKNIDYKLLVNDLIVLLQEKLITEDNSSYFKMVDNLVETLRNINFIKNIKNYFEIVLYKCNDEVKQKKKEPQKNVSRETIKAEIKKEVYQKVKIKKYDENELLQLLVNAEKQIKLNDISNIEKNTTKVLVHTEMIKYYTSFKKTNVVASSEKIILLTSKDQETIENINEHMNHSSYKQFIQLLIGKDKELYVITENEFKTIVQLFKEKSRLNALPTKQVEEPNIVKKVEIELTPLEKMKEVFEDQLMIEGD